MSASNAMALMVAVSGSTVIFAAGLALLCGLLGYGSLMVSGIATAIAGVILAATGVFIALDEGWV